MKRGIAKYVALLRCLLESQGRASMTCWTISTLASTRVEVSRDDYEFHHGIA
jgi:hypothetical protein